MRNVDPRLDRTIIAHLSEIQRAMGDAGISTGIWSIPIAYLGVVRRFRSSPSHSGTMCCVGYRVVLLLIDLSFGSYKRKLNKEL